MRSLVLISLIAVGALAAVNPAGAVHARTAVTTRMPCSDTSSAPACPPFSGPMNSNRCGFPIDVGIVANNEYVEETTLPDGTVIDKITGELVESFTNDATGLTIVRNVSGPATFIYYPDGTARFVGQGLTWLQFGPLSQANTGEPGLVFTSGRVVVDVSASHVATSFSLDGNQTNGCDLLAG